MTVRQQFSEIWRIMWKIGGPVGVLVYKLDGTLGERVAKARSEL